MDLNIAHACVTFGANGPGRRFTIWLQGCPRACPGCFNPELQPFAERRRVSALELAREVAAAVDVEGVSLTGGEPFAQPEGLVALLDAVQELTPPRRLSVLAFTGYPLEELENGPGSRRELLRRIDLLVDGPYDRSRPTTLPLRGSANQSLVPLTASGERLRGRVEGTGAVTYEVIITERGEILLTGFPPEELVRRISERTGPRTTGSRSPSSVRRGPSSQAKRGR